MEHRERAHAEMIGAQQQGSRTPIVVSPCSTHAGASSCASTADGGSSSAPGPASSEFEKQALCQGMVAVEPGAYPAISQANGSRGNQLAQEHGDLPPARRTNSSNAALICSGWRRAGREWGIFDAFCACRTSPEALTLPPKASAALLVRPCFAALVCERPAPAKRGSWALPGVCAGVQESARLPSLL